MSGIEVAGIALAVFPILVGGLNQMVAGIENIKRWKRYKLKLQEYASILESAQVYFFDTLDELLNDIIPSDEELELLILEPLGPRWKTPQYDHRLRERLDRSYKSYLNTVRTLVEKLKTMCEKLGVDTSGTVRWDNYSTVEREMQRMKLTFSKSIYKELLDDIDRANKDLREFTHQNIALEPMKRKRRSRRPIAELQLIRKYAASLYQVLMTEKAWKCSCRTLHMVSLRLEARPRTLAEVKANRTQEHVFRVMISVENETKDSKGTPHWKEIEIVPSLGSGKPLQPPYSSPSAVRDLRSANRGVRFAPEVQRCRTETAKNATQIGWRYIEDICSALCTPGISTREIGYLIDDRFDKHEHRLYRANTTMKAQALSRSLEDLLQSRGHAGDIGLSRRSRLEIAVVLASSVLQLDGSSWLKSGWTSGDIFFHHDNGQHSAVAQQHDPPQGQISGSPYPYLSWQQCCYDGMPPVEHLRLSNHLVRSDALLALGLTLVELCFGRTLAEMRKAEDIDHDQPSTRLRTATRLHRPVYNEMGPAYGDVVRRCLFQTFDVRELSLDIEEVQQKVLDDVVTPLVEDLNSFNGI